MERNGEETDLGDRNRVARARNDERDRLRNDQEAVSAEIIDLAAERERREAERDLRAAVRTHSPPRILDTLTERRSTFSRGDLNRELAEGHPRSERAGRAHRSDFGASGCGRA